ncbi:acyl carrier protein [Falsirhodobacter xinxiangensis]|uniref:acyl carrier protein n=1 Tax=Falsirhodobacter xinxiangensis TaxID=2530049 RepID=UPI0010AAC4F7|nr:acyl carrier protein [Rhodobacter xinxiangensis]
MLENSIKSVFNSVWASEKTSPPPELSADTVLLNTGLDSLGFAIFVSSLEDELGYDPFTISQDAYYPQTFAEFVAFYEKFRPAA